MNERNARPNVSAVLSGLKDFQRDTVEYVFGRLYTDSDATRRFLLADEVGLGKTLVARGVIAKAIDYLWDTVPRIDIVYVCSNVDIARQNIARLNPTNQKDFALASRITLLPTQVSDLAANKINLISITPGTSFDLKSATGIAEERALLYWLLERAWAIPGTGPLNVLQGDSTKANFRRLVQWYKGKHIDDTLSNDFIEALERKVSRERSGGLIDIRTRFDDLCERFGYARIHVPRGDRRGRAEVVGELRALLARACLRALEPDLIILDEFQRFKYLLEGKDDAGRLAQELFNYSDETASARVLLLSATPYKMYTMTHEAAEDDHYKDFMKTLEFLLPQDGGTDQFKRLLQEYRREVYRLGGDGTFRLRPLVQDLEERLKKVMVRTERLAATEDRNGMLAEAQSVRPRLEPQDLACYVTMENLARLLGRTSVMEYWKSAPYLLNFMEDYELKREFRRALVSGESPSIVEALARNRDVLLHSADIRAYRKLDPANARLRCLQEQTVGAGAWRLLWVPPSLPYYQLGHPFADPALSRLTKRLVFSSWKVVPRVVAAVLSYEAEREMICSYEPDAVNTTEERRRRSPLLRFAYSDERPTGMPVLALIYPCLTLASTCDPLEFLPSSGQGLPTMEAVVESLTERIAGLLEAVGPAEDEYGLEDESWYWAAPILLDLAWHGAETTAWFGQTRLAAAWAGTEGAEEDDESRTQWLNHVEEARKLVQGEHHLGRRPKDLARVLAQMAIAGPGIAALRALARIGGGYQGLHAVETRTHAALMARSFVSLFNHPETMALIRGLDREEPYWRRVLEYCVAGCLQAVLDEYAHLLRELLGLIGMSPEETTGRVADAVSAAIGLRTSTLGVDDIAVDNRANEEPIHRLGMRTRFSLRFGQERTEDERTVNRAEQVRMAFNSPFWPFVLVTTSVGQEGLDFHPYCHAVVHWNLPSNPVDLEQREGRIHRYKGHAVRKNLARALLLSGHPLEILETSADPWDALFEFGKEGRQPQDSDLVPYWVYTVENGAKIERHVPIFPLSRDVERYRALRSALTVYRMAFGQSRQEDFVSYLSGRLSESELQNAVQELRIDLSPPSAKGDRTPAY